MSNSDFYDNVASYKSNNTDELVCHVHLSVQLFPLKPAIYTTNTHWQNKSHKTTSQISPIHPHFTDSSVLQLRRFQQPKKMSCTFMQFSLSYTEYSIQLHGLHICDVTKMLSISAKNSKRNCLSFSLLDPDNHYA